MLMACNAYLIIAFFKKNDTRNNNILCAYPLGYAVCSKISISIYLQNMKLESNKKNKET